MKLRPEKVFEPITKSTLEVEPKNEEVLSIHEQQYGEAEIYSNLHTVLRKNLAHRQEIVNNLG